MIKLVSKSLNLNNPLNLKYIIQKIADIKGLTNSYVMEKTTCNVMSKFDL